MGAAEEENIYVFKRMSVGKNQVCLAEKSLVHIGHRMSGIARRMHELYAHPGMIDEQAEEFAGRVAGSSDYSYLFHCAVDYSDLPFFT